MSLLSRLFGRRPEPPRFTAPLTPDERVCIIGDVHGCLGLLTELLTQVDAIGPDRIICVGDYVDRGEESAQVIAFLMEEEQRRAGQMICLKGNHEEMMLDFLDAPERRAEHWLRYGGLQTLASYGVGMREPEEMRDQLAESMGEAQIAWMRALPLIWKSGNLCVTHAGMKPSRAIEAQKEGALLWGHPEFGQVPRADGIWVARGHVIVDVPFAESGVISVDTGSYATGRLTAADVTPAGEVSFLTVPR